MKLVAAPARLSTAAATFEADFAARLHWSADTDAAIEQRVADILADVQSAATRRCWSTPPALTASGRQHAALELTQAELKAAFDAIPAQQRGALTAAAARVRSYHEAQKKASARAGATATKTAPAGPEGHAAGPRGHLRARRQGRLTRSVLMNAIPAHVAGVPGNHHGGAHARPAAKRTRWCWPPPTWRA